MNQLDKINKSISVGLSALRMQEILLLSDWADKNFYLSPESSSVEGRWKTQPLQRGIMNAIGIDDVKVITLFKPARMGFTKILCAAVGYFVAHKQRNTLLYQPTDGDARDFSNDEIKTMIRDVPVVADKLCVSPEKRSNKNATHRKEFIGCVLDIKGGKSATNYRRMTKDAVFFDELEGFDEDIEGEGSPTALGDVRITTSAFPKSVRGSTPGDMGYSQIANSMDDADIILERYLPCPDCGTYQVMVWEEMERACRGSKSTAARYPCKACGSMWEHDQYEELDKMGRWGTEDGLWLVDDGDFYLVNSEGDTVATPAHIGFKMWAAYSYFIAWHQIVEEYRKAKESEKKGRPEKLKTFTNVRLARLWEDKGNQINASPLMDRREDYGALIPNGALYITAGVDVHPDRIEMEVVAWGVAFESWNIEYVVFKGPPSITPDMPGGEDTVWSRLDKHLLKSYKHENGPELRIVAACVDSGTLTQQVYRFCANRKKRRIHAIKGMPGQGRRIAGQERRSVTYKQYTFMQVGVDTAKETLYQDLKVTEPGAGYCHFPLDREQEYFDGLTAEKCVKKYVRGKLVKEWKLKAEHLRNEPLDCRNYARAAAEMVKLDVYKLKATMDQKQLEHDAAKKAMQNKKRIEHQEEVSERQNTPIKKRRKRGLVSSVKAH